MGPNMGGGMGRCESLGQGTMDGKMGEKGEVVWERKICVGGSGNGV